jgi:two-component system sensor histidine kinase/response regulator
VLEISAGQGPSGYILLAEDHPVNQRVGTAMLETLGFEVDVVADGAEAVKAAALSPYEAILMDCQLPVQDGYQATRQIRRLQAGSRRTPIIAVTGSATEADQQRCLAADMDDYLTKPLGLKALRAMLARWVSDGPDLTIAVDQVANVPATHVGELHIAGPARPVLDARILGRLKRLGSEAGQDLTGQLAALFLSDVADRLVALREALARDDTAAVERSAHTLTGASANIGATELARLCATLATDGSTGDLSDAGALIDAIEAELGRVRFALGSASVTS